MAVRISFTTLPPFFGCILHKLYLDESLQFNHLYHIILKIYTTKMDEPKGANKMKIFTVSFLGTDKLTNPLLSRKDSKRKFGSYFSQKNIWNFWLAVMVNLISLWLQLFADVSELFVTITAHLFWCFPMRQRNTETMQTPSVNIAMKLKSVLFPRISLLNIVLGSLSDHEICRQEWSKVHQFVCAKRIMNIYNEEKQMPTLILKKCFQKLKQLWVMNIKSSL